MRLLAKHLPPERFQLLVMEHPDDGPQTRTLAERAGIELLAAPAPGASLRRRIRELRRLYSERRIDVLHFHSPASGGQAPASLAARLARVPATIATYHQIHAMRLKLRTRWVNQVTHRFLIDQTLAVSRDVARSLSRQAGVPAGRVRVLHNGIDLSEEPATLPEDRARAEGEVRLGYFGRLSQEKGVADLLEALADVAGRCPGVRLWVAGDGPDRESLSKQAAELGISERVEFLGFRPDARALMAQVDIVVHAPRYEGFGLVLLEAMAAGKPVVTNDAPGGMTEIVVPGETGLIAPAGSASALADALVRLIEDPEERGRLGARGRLRCEREFSAEVMARRMAEVYEAAARR